ncbi:MAG TPA: RsmD family RNA methyltransferase [Pirellulales bacterium]|nr:RsmD family RNA methyltransferase [Pirellulales bacterium]
MDQPLPRKRKDHRAHERNRSSDGSAQETPLRIVGGSLRGRKLATTGQERTRPMKDRVREALFNLLGSDVVDKQAIDLFAGSGALGLEAISRRARSAVLVEQHLATAEIARANALELGVAAQTTVEWGDAFLWARKLLPMPGQPWVVFCSPPYSFFVERQAEMLALIGTLVERALPGSVFVVEFDSRFDPHLLPHDGDWLVRAYPPAVVAIYRKEEADLKLLDSGA